MDGCPGTCLLGAHTERPEAVAPWQRKRLEWATMHLDSHRPHRRPSVVLLLGLFIGPIVHSPSASAQIPDWQVNTTVVGSQLRPVVLRAPGGDLIMVWQSEGFDGSEEGIALRRFQGDGTPLDAGERLVNGFTAGEQADPDAALDGTGEVVVVWEGASGVDDFGITARRIAADGNPIGSDIPVNLVTTGTQRDPRVDRAASGVFAIAWYDFSGGRVWARRFAAEGTPLDDPFGVSRAGMPVSSGFDVAFAPNGELLATWGDDDEIFVRRWDGEGLPIGEAISIADPLDNNGAPQIEMSADGRYLVLWRGFGLPNDQLVKGQRISAADRLQGPNVVFNENTVAFAGVATAVAEEDGGYRAVWQQFGGTSGVGWNLYSRRIDAAGQLVGSAEAMATGTLVGNQGNPHLAALAGSGSVLVWDGPDQDQNGIFTDMPTTEPLFTDGFESGDTTRWYLSAPSNRMPTQ